MRRIRNLVWQKQLGLIIAKKPETWRHHADDYPVLLSQRFADDVFGAAK